MEEKFLRNLRRKGKLMFDGILLTITVYVVSLLLFVVPYGAWQWRRKRSSFFTKECIQFAILPEVALLLLCIVAGFAVSWDKDKTSVAVFSGILFTAPIAIVHGWILYVAHQKAGRDRVREMRMSGVVSEA